MGKLLVAYQVMQSTQHATAGSAGLRRQRALEVLFAELQENSHIVRSARDSQVRDDVVQIAAEKMMKDGLIGWTMTPTTDDEVRKVLRTLLGYKGKDAWRGQRHDPMAGPPGLEAADRGPGPEEALDLAEGGDLVEALEDELFSEVVPQVAGWLRRDASTRLVDNARRLRTMTRDGQSVQSVAETVVRDQRPPAGLSVCSRIHSAGRVVHRETAMRLVATGIRWKPSALQRLAPCDDGGACCRDLDGLARVVMRELVASQRVALDQVHHRVRVLLHDGIGRLRDERRLEQNRARQLQAFVSICLRLRTR
ncbi:MAG: hypothetical protein ACOYOB_20355 [Myxococcota bacterium]